MKLLPFITTLLALLSISIYAQSGEEFSVEQRFKSPAKPPSSIIVQLTKQVAADDTRACQEARSDELFEAQLVSLNKSTKAYLVKPAHKCLCGADGCPMWMFRVKGNPAKLIWSTRATSALEILDKKLNGYSKLKEMSTVAAHGSETIWAWNVSSYSEIYKNVWVWDADKNCRLGEETTQLMDGKMVQHTEKCIQE